MVSNTKAARILGRGKYTSKKAKLAQDRTALTPAQAAAKVANQVVRALVRVSQMTPQERLDQDARAASKEVDSAAATARDVARMLRNASAHTAGRFSCCQKAITSGSGTAFATGAPSICGECQRH